MVKDFPPAIFPLSSLHHSNVVHLEFMIVTSAYSATTLAPPNNLPIDPPEYQRAWVDEAS